MVRAHAVAAWLAPRGRPAQRWLVGLAVAALQPMWLFVYPPALDWVQHTLLVDILLRLARGEAAVAEYYAASVQPVGYHLFYLAAWPLGLLGGAPWAVAVVMSAVWLGHLGTAYWALARRGGPTVLAAVATWAFYGGHFAWGFLATLVATPFVFAALVWLADGGQAPSGAPTPGGPLFAVSLLASVAHVVFVPLLGAAAVCSVLSHGRRALRGALCTSGAVALATLPGAISRALRVWRAPLDAPAAYEFSTWRRGLRRFLEMAQAFDHSWAYAGCLLLVTFLLAVALSDAWLRRGEAAGRRHLFWWLTMGVAVACVWLVPVTTGGAVGPSFLLNIRPAGVVPLCLMMAASEAAVWHRPRWGRLGSGMCLLGAVLTLTGVLAAGRLYDRDMREWLQGAEVLRPGSRLGVVTERVALGAMWPPVRLSLASAAFVGRLAWQNAMFVGDHLPVRERRPGAYDRLEGAAKRYAQALTLPPSGASARAPDVWQWADALFVQQETTAELRQPEPTEGVTLAAGRKWRLYGPPPAVAHVPEKRAAAAARQPAPQ